MQLNTAAAEPNLASQRFTHNLQYVNFKILGVVVQLSLKCGTEDISGVLQRVQQRVQPNLRW
jgi:hypothetical protein